MVKGYRKLLGGSKESIRGHKRCTTSGNTKTSNQKPHSTGTYFARL